MDELANLDAWVQSVFEPTTDEYGNLVSGSTPAGFDLSGGESILRRITQRNRRNEARRIHMEGVSAKKARARRK